MENTIYDWIINKNTAHTSDPQQVQNHLDQIIQTEAYDEKASKSASEMLHFNESIDRYNITLHGDEIRIVHKVTGKIIRVKTITSPSALSAGSRHTFHSIDHNK